jgi:hypothetical protein
MTMSVFCGTADTTDPTIGTMKLPLVFVIQQDTDGTPIGPKRDATSGTYLSGVLCFLTRNALYCIDGVAIHGMSLFLVFLVFAFHLVVTKATSEICVTTGRKKQCLLFVMYASRLGHLDVPSDINLSLLPQERRLKFI